jgi:hypothetical protein
MKRLIANWVLVASLSLAGCRPPESDFEGEEGAGLMAKLAASPEAMAPSAGAPPMAVPARDMTQGRYVTRNANMTVQVDDLAAYLSVVTTVTARLGGYVVSQQASNSGHKVHAQLSLRVPAARLDEALGGYAETASFVESRSIYSEDITAQYVDTEARLNTRREVEKQYLALLKQAKSVQDMVAIQQQLAQVREEIESAEAVHRNLAGQVEYSAIDLHAIQELGAGYYARMGWFRELKGALRDGIAMFRKAVFSAVRIWPFAVLALLAAAAIWWRRRRRS